MNQTEDTITIFTKFIYQPQKRFTFSLENML